MVDAARREDAGESARESPWRTLAVVLAGLVLVRAFLVFACADVFFYGEELGKGGVAKAILDGTSIPYHQLAYAYHEGGGFVICHLRALAFLLLGESILAAKLVAVATTSLVLCAGFLLTLEAFGRRAALIFGALFVLCPDAWLRFSLVSIGTHFEALFFQAAILLTTFRILRGDGRARNWFGLGLAAGFGLYFSLVALGAIGAAGLMLLVGLRRRIFDRGLLVATGGALLGAVPLFVMLHLVGLDAVRVRDFGVVERARPSVLTALLDLLKPLQADGRLDDWIQLGLTVTLALAALVLTRERRARLAVTGVLGYLGVYVAIYLGSGLAVSMNGIWLIWWRMCPLWFFGSVLAAAGIDALLARWRALGVAVLALLAACGLMDVVRLTIDARPDRLAANASYLARAKGYDLAEYFDQLVGHLEGDEGDKIRALLELDDPTHLLPASIAYAVFEHSDLPLERILAISRDAFGVRYEQAILGLGHHLHPMPGYDVPAAFAKMPQIPPAERATFSRALGRTGLGQRYRRDRLLEQIGEPVPAELRADFLFGTGWRVWRAYILDPAGGAAFVQSLPPAEREPILRGLAFEREAWMLP
jgi:hypothetical protein